MSEVQSGKLFHCRPVGFFSIAEANLLHGGNYAVDKAKQIPLSNTEHSMYYDYCHIEHTFRIG